MKKQAILIAILILIGINVVSAATYYVDINNKNCKDSYTTKQAQNISTPWCTFTTGLGNLNSGDTLYVSNGTYSDSAGYVYQDKALTAKTSIKAYSGAKPILTSVIPDFNAAPNTKWTKVSSGLWSASYSSSADSSSWAAAYSKTGVSLFTYDSLSALKNTANPEGIFFDTGTRKLYLRLSDANANPNNIPFSISTAYVLSIRGVTGSGLELSGLTIQWGLRGIYVLDSSNIAIINNVVKGGLIGIDVKQSDNTKLQGNTIFMTRGSNWNWELIKNSPMEGFGIWLENDLNGLDISNNNVYGHFNGIDVVSTGSSGSSMFSGIKVYQNEIHDTMDDGLEIEDYCNGGQFYNNKIYDVFVAISLSPANALKSRCSISNNVLAADKSVKRDSQGTYEFGECYKIIDASGSSNFDITHNTCVGRGVYTTTDLSHTQKNNVWKDNIFYSPSDYKLLEKAGLSADGVSYDYNLYWRADGGGIFSYWNSDTNNAEFTSLADAKAGSLWDGKWDIHSKQEDPLFTSPTTRDYKPKTGSPACAMSSTGSYVGAIPCSSLPPQNHPPTQSTPLLRASDYPDNTTNANLTCYNQSTADADGDRVSNVYSWYRDSTLMTTFNNRTVITASNTEVGQRWVCQVTPYDGKLYGTSMNSSPLVIRANPVCGDKICNGKENCSTCSGDCGSCPIPNITACTLSNRSWSEDDMLKMAYDLNACFYDPLHATLSFRASGNRNITVSTINGLVDLYAPPDWNGVEYVTFIASSGNRSARTNRVTLAVLPMPECGDGKCESGETCSGCPADCGTCKKKSSGGGGGGGGSLSFLSSSNIGEPTKQNSTENDNTEHIQNEMDIGVEEPAVNNTAPKEEPKNDTAALFDQTGNAPDNAIQQVDDSVAPVNEPEAQITANAIAKPGSKTSRISLVMIAFVALGLFAVYPGLRVIAKTRSSKNAVYELASSDYSADFIDVAEMKEAPVQTTQPAADALSDLVLKAVDELGYEHRYAEQLHNYAKAALLKGYALDRITKELLSAGWAFHIVDNLAKMYANANPGTTSRAQGANAPEQL